MAIEFKFEKISERSLPEIEALCTECFGNSKLSQKYLEWIYFQNPDGPVIGYNAYSQDELAAHYAIVPRNYFTGKGYTALSVNTATSKKFRGMSLFGKLAELTYARAKKLGIEEVVGVANSKSINTFIKRLDFEFEGQVELYAIFKSQLKTLPLIHISEQQLTWRLKNPSAEYKKLKIDKDKFAILRITNFGHICLGIVNYDIDISFADLKFPILLYPILSNSAFIPVGFKIPKWLMPSPWHVISRKIYNGKNIKPTGIMGIHMDTF